MENHNKEVSVHLSGVDKSFHAGDQIIQALKKVDFTCYAGEIFFVVGPSGCGKTTLLSLLCGTLSADAGKVVALGQELTAISTAEVTDFRAKNVGFIFQQFNLIPSLTAAENVAIPLRINNVPLTVALEEAKTLLEQVGLSDKFNERPSNLSGGQQQRVAIARALIHKPSIIVCDEPTSALDSVSGEHVMELLKNTITDGKRTVIIVTHDPRIYHYADRMAEMEDGRILRVIDSREEIARTHFL